jgi:hypothetical protein
MINTTWLASEVDLAADAAELASPSSRATQENLRLMGRFADAGFPSEQAFRDAVLAGEVEISDENRAALLGE